jgi:hypothetical protein
MEAFSAIPPEWRETALHATEFCCPQCRAQSKEANGVWIDRSSPVMKEGRRQWQEFYLCHCGTSWWAWSTDRPPNEFSDRSQPSDGGDIFFGYF